MTGKIALITGGGRGIGRACALKLARTGYDVCVNYMRDVKSANEVIDAVKQTGQKAIAVKADVSNEIEVVEMFKKVDSELGILCALVNNAGIILPQNKLVDMDSERIEKIFKINVVSSFICAREAVKRMSTQYGGVGGAIVNVSSRAARLGGASEYIDYASTKGAIDTFTKGLAIEVADQGIRVNGVRPGIIETQIHADGGEPNRVERMKHGVPMRRGGQPQEVANAIAWLLSDEASYSTGTILDCAGGR